MTQNPLLDDPDFAPSQSPAPAGNPLLNDPDFAPASLAAMRTPGPLVADPDFNPAPDAAKADVSVENRRNPSTAYRWGALNPPEAAAPVDTSTDVAKSAAAQGALGVSDIAGMPGTLGQLYDAGVNKLYSGVGHAGEYLGAIPKGKTDEFMADVSKLNKGLQSPAEQQGQVNTIAGLPFPTGAAVENAVKENVPFTQYEPQTNAGRVAGSAARMATGVATTGGTGLTNIAGNVVKGAAAGAASEIAGHAAENYDLPTWADPVARTFGAIGGGGVAHGITSAIASVALPTEGARSALADAMATDARNGKLRMTPDQIQQAHDAGLTPTIHDMGGPTSDKVLGYYSQLTPEAQEESGNILASIQSRRAEAGTATGAHIDSLYGESLDPARTQAAIDAANTTANNAVYGLARAHPDAQSMWTKNLYDLTAAPPIQAAMKSADSLALYPNSEVKPFIFGADGNVASAPNLSYWDQVKRNLDDQISTAQRTGANNDARLLQGLKGNLTNELDQIVPAYATARNTAAEGFGASNAIEAGYNSMKNMDAFKAADAAKALGKMSPDQRDLFSQGAASWMKEQAVDSSKGPGFLARKLSNPAFAARAKAAVGEDNFNSILGHAAASDLMSKVKPIAASATAPKSSHFFGTLGKGAGAVAGGLADLVMMHLGAGVPVPYLGTVAAAALGSAGGHYAGQAVDSILATGARMRSAPMTSLAAENNPDAVKRFGQELANSDAARKGYSRTSQFLSDKAIQAYRANPNFTPQQGYQQPQAAPFKRGGSVKSGHQHLVDRLMREVEKAKRVEKGRTSVLLRQPDEAIAKALNVAQAAI